MNDLIDLLLDIAADRARLWPIYRHLFRLSDVPADPLCPQEEVHCRVMLLWLEARYRGIWTTQLDNGAPERPMAALDQRLDGLQALDAALNKARDLFPSGRLVTTAVCTCTTTVNTLGETFVYRNPGCPHHGNASTDGKPGPKKAG